MAEDKVMLTQEGYNKLVEKLDNLKSVKRIEIAERLKAAIALGDLSENSEYTDAKNEQALLEGEIKEIEAKIHHSEIIHDNADSNVVTLGKKVRVQLPDGEEMTFMLVGETEADFESGRLSNESPVGAAIIGQSAGTAINVHTPSGIMEYKILEIVKE